MNKKINLNNKEYQLVKDYKDAFNMEDVLNLITNYYDDYDYILGDWAYGKLRLKGFCNKGNNKINNINDYENIDDYIKNYCAYDCKYFILKKDK